MSTEEQLKAMQLQIAAMLKGMEDLKMENEKLKKRDSEAEVGAVALSLSDKSDGGVSVSDANLTRLRILSALELKVGESLKLKSDSAADVLAYKRAVENYLKANAVLFVLDDAERDAKNVFLLVEREVQARVFQFLVDSWPESLRLRYSSIAENDPKKLWSLLMKDSFKVEVSKITAAKENFKKLQYRLGMKPEDLISKLEKMFHEYAHLIALFNEEKAATERISFPDLERVGALYHSLEEVANESPMFIVLRLALKDLDSWQKAKTNFVSVCDTVNETYAAKKTISGVLRTSKRAHSKEVRCWNCGERGHMRAECDKEEAKCPICGKVGHLEEDCWQKCDKTTDARHDQMVTREEYGRMSEREKKDYMAQRHAASRDDGESEGRVRAIPVFKTPAKKPK